MTQETNKPLAKDILTEDDLFTAMDTMADAKIAEIQNAYGQKPELAKVLAATIDRIQNEHADFKMKEGRDMLDVGILGVKVNTPKDVYEIFIHRIEMHCGDLLVAARNLNTNKDQLEMGPTTGVEQIKKETQEKARKAA